MDKKIRVQILNPPMFVPSGKVVDREIAWQNKDWIGTFNLWIIQKHPVESIVYQLRSPNIGWAPNKLDVAAAGHYENLETVSDGLREVREELGKNYNFSDLINVGRKINVGIGQDGRQRNTVSDIFLIEDDSNLGSYKLEEAELYAICSCPVDLLIKVHTVKNYSFEVNALMHDGKEIALKVNRDMFPPNWDNYHFKMALLIKRYFQGEKNLIY